MNLASIETEAQWEFLTTKSSYLTTREYNTFQLGNVNPFRHKKL